MQVFLSHFNWHLGCHNGKLNGMSVNVQMDQAGRVVLPKKLRERFRLQAGDTLSLEVKGDAIELRPKKARARLERINGVLVLATEDPLPEGRDFVSESREERIDELARRASEPE